MAITATAAGMIGLLESIASEALGDGLSYNITESLNDTNDTVVVESTSLETTSDWIQASEWLLCSSLAITLFCIAIQGFLSLEHHTRLIPYQTRVGFRIITGIIIVCSPTFGLNPLNLLGLVAALCFICVLWEMIGSLPNKDEYYGTGEEPEGSLSIGNYIKHSRPTAMGTMKQDGTLVIDMATMRNGTLVFEPKSMVRKGVAPNIYIQ